ncbi:MAG: ABC transporter ATP-binding protein [Ferruginibacter sp.]
MKIELTKVGKRFNREWIFRNFNYTFTSGVQYAITGPNGSGKSTLLQVIAGAILQSEGTIQFEGDDVVAEPYLTLSFAAPYLELIEEMTATEFLSFHHTFKPLTKAIKNILEEISLTPAANKQIRYYSSGMKQRLKLAQAFFSETKVLMLDEPTTNLDAEGIALYHTLIKKYCDSRLVIVSSNELQEYDFCEEVLNINDYKS